MSAAENKLFVLPGYWAKAKEIIFNNYNTVFKWNRITWESHIQNYKKNTLLHKKNVTLHWVRDQTGWKKSKFRTQVFSQILRLLFWIRVRKKLWFVKSKIFESRPLKLSSVGGDHVEYIKSVLKLILRILIDINNII